MVLPGGEEVQTRLLGQDRHLDGVLDALVLTGALPVAGSVVMSPTVKIPNCIRRPPCSQHWFSMISCVLRELERSMFISQLSRCGARPTWKQGSAASPGILCCLMTSESFGCHDISGHRLGGPAGEESCCLGLSERAAPVTVVAARAAESGADL